MRAAYYQLLSHIALVVHSCEQNSSLASALGKAGLGEGALTEGKKLVGAGEALIGRKAFEAFEDKYYEHNLHYSAAELDMWRSTVRFLIKKAGVADPALVARAMGDELHTADHTVTTAVRGLRLLGVLRTDERLYGPLSKVTDLHDQLGRGRAMLGKIYKNSDITMAPSSAGHADYAVFAEVDQLRQAMVKWVSALGEASTKLAGTPLILGELGYLPDGVGLPMGGTAFNVPLHERAQRVQPPSTENLRPDPGWSIGRQGRNNENWGPGFVEPTFE